MSMKLVGVGAALALLASSTVCAQQQSFGRGSVYAIPGAASAPAKAARATSGNGRGSVYAPDLPSPTPRDRVIVKGPFKPGRA
jgi:hypothetical protein